MVPAYFRRPRVVVLLGSIVFICTILIYETLKRDSALAKLEFQIAQLTQGKVRRVLAQSSEQDYPYFNDDDTILIYNRVPKTGSTSFAGVAYELCYKNKFHVLHVNTTNNVHTISIPDQITFIQNITEWSEKKPAMYHGHFYYIDFSKLGFNQRRPIYINIVRKPLDRLLSYYYFVRYGDDFRPYLKRRRQGNQMTFDECVAKDHKDCDPVNLWLQVPFFCGQSFRCRQPGSRWALEQAKFNLINNYLLVGVTEQIGDFIAMLEVILPRFFKGAYDLFLHGEKSHLRKTNKKDTPSEETIEKIQESTIWKMENEFYEFALEQFQFHRRLTFQSLDSFDSDDLKKQIEVDNKPTYLLTDGRTYIPKGTQFHYEKVRPR